MPESSPRHLQLPFDGFLALLESRGFRAGVEKRSHLLQLLDSDLAVDPARLKTVMSPIFASNDAQQTEFYQLFDQFFPELSSAETLIAGEAINAARPKFERKKFIFVLIGNALLITLLALGAGRMILHHREAKSVAAQNNNTKKVDHGAPLIDVMTGQARRPRTLSASPVAKQNIFRLLLELAPYVLALGLLLFELTWYLRRQAILAKKPSQIPPSVWPLKPDGHSLLPIEPATIRYIAKRLRARRPGPELRIDLPNTIRETIRSLGFIHLAFRRLALRPEHTVLIDRRSEQDHLALFFGNFVSALAREGVLVHSYVYERDPEICVASENGRTAFLEDLAASDCAQRLLIFGDARELLNPYSLEPSRAVAAFQRFPERAFLSSASSDVTIVGRALANYIQVLPASFNALASLADRWNGSAKPREYPEHDSRSNEPSWDELRWSEHLDRYVRDLRSYLGPEAFKWLCACALHSQLNYDLTLQLGSERGIGFDYRREATLKRLFGLRWFREGDMPVALRQELSNQLDAATKRRIRAIIIDFLKAHPAPQSSFAEIKQKCDISAQQWALEPLRSTEIQQDRELMRVVGETGAPRLANVIPRAVTGWFFRYGIPSLGLRFGFRLLLVGASISLVLASVWSHLPPVREANQYFFTLINPPLFQDSACDESTHAPTHPPQFRTATGFYESGVAYYHDYNYGCAVKKFDFAIQLDPRMARAYAKRADSLLNLRHAGKEYDQAFRDIQQALKLDKNQPDNYFVLARYYLSTNKYQEQLEACKTGLALDQNNELLHRLLAVAYWALKDNKTARIECKVALRLDPNDASAWNDLALIETASNDYPAAEYAYRKAIKIDPDYTQPYVNLGNLLARQKKNAEALSQYVLAIEHNPLYYEAFRRRGLLYGELHQYPKALEDLNIYVKDAPSDPYGLSDRCWLHNELQSWNEAAADCNAAIKLAPNFAYAFFERGIAYQALGENAKAAADFEVVLASPPADYTEIARSRLQQISRR